jgi:hypothetical protein
MPGYPASARGYQSRALHHWRAADASLLALDGLAGVFTRSGTASGFDVNGATITYRDHQPPFTMIDTDADTVRDTLALGVSSALGQIVHARNPRHTAALTLYAKFVDRRPGTDTGYLVQLVWGTSSYDFGIRYNGTLAYRAEAGDGTQVTSTSGTVGGAGTAMECLATLTAAGVTTLTTSVTGGVPLVASASSARARPASSTTGVLTLSPSAAAAAADVMVVKLGFGIRTMDEMRELG